VVTLDVVCSSLVVYGQKSGSLRRLRYLGGPVPEYCCYVTEANSKLVVLYSRDARESLKKQRN